MKNIGIALSAFDHDEWSWSVERLRDGETVWGRGSDTIAEGCETSKREAVNMIKAELAKLGLTIKDVTHLPF
jgi:hypothetical protein